MLHKHLHKVLFLINLGLNDALATKCPFFIEKFEVLGLYKLLTELQPPPEMKKLLPHTISRASEARKTLLGKQGGIIVVAGKDEAQTQDNDR